MTEVIQTPDASAPPPDGAPAPSTTPPDATGTQAPAGYVPQTELEKAQATARGLQSEKDKLAARVRELEKPTPTPTEGATSTAADPAAIMAEFTRQLELRDAKAEFRSDTRFAAADPAIFSRATEFDSVEAFEAALLSSAESRQSERAKIEAEVSERILADVRAKYPDYQPGSGPGTPPSTEGAAPADGAMTLDRLAQMGQSDFEAWVAKNPEEYARVTSGA